MASWSSLLNSSPDSFTSSPCFPLAGAAHRIPGPGDLLHRCRHHAFRYFAVTAARSGGGRQTIGTIGSMGVALRASPMGAAPSIPSVNALPGFGKHGTSGFGDWRWHVAVRRRVGTYLLAGRSGRYSGSGLRAWDQSHRYGGVLR